MEVDLFFKQQLIDNQVVTKAGRWHKGSERRLASSALLDTVMLNTAFLDETYALHERVNHLLYKLTKPKSCDNCGIRIAIKQNREKLVNYCSSKCSNSHSDKKETTKKRLLDKYGVTHNSMLESVKQSKIKSAQAKYGVDNVFQSEIIKRKLVKTNLERYGVDNPSKSPEIRKKVEATNRSLFGSDYRHMAHIDPKNTALVNNGDWLQSKINEGLRVFEIADLLGMSEERVHQKLNEFEVKRSRVCKTSRAELKLIEFVSSLYSGDLVTSDRTAISPYHLDIYAPDNCIAIEYNGNYWHAEKQGRDKRYHINKTKACLEKGIKLIHVFEHEWLYKKEIIKSRLSNLFKSSTRVYARKCSLRLVNQMEANTFYESTHIQGSCNASTNLALFVDGEAVAMMSFRRPRFNKKYDVELVRYSTALGLNVVGGASKLLSNFLKLNKDKNTVISYKDLKWGYSSYYEKLGFTKISDSQPSYSYVHASDYLKLYNRVDFQKHKLAAKLDTFDPDKTEYQNMLDNGYDRIWDCGTSVYVYTR